MTAPRCQSRSARSAAAHPNCQPKQALFASAAQSRRDSDLACDGWEAVRCSFGERVFSESDLLLFARRTDKHQPAAFLRQSAIIEIMSLNLNPLYDTKVTLAGEVAVFRGANAKILDFVDWMASPAENHRNFLRRKSSRAAAVDSNPRSCCGAV